MKRFSIAVSLASMCALAATVWLAISSGVDARAESPKTIRLPPDRKLVNVSWQCNSTVCTPWFLTRQLVSGERVETYTLWNTNSDSYTIMESSAPK